jgi:hypothetical protein
MEVMSLNPTTGKVFLRVFGGTALLLAILFAIGELGSLGQ